ncbi:MAG: sensor hybrid histidine kinase [Verrucomicrobia bacterium]|nr:sensor hybrid histidine kinase [Verrucomicrobiota bacterium]
MKVLHVEDNPLDAELIHQLVMAEWPDCEISLVATEPEFLTELRHKRFDVILSDFSLPSFSGMSALKLAKEHSPEVPFIFVSGTIGEDSAIAGVKSGARDYVLKDRMKRLVLSIRDAVRESREHEVRVRAENTVLEQSDILNRAREAIIITDLEDLVLYWNAGAERIFGWPSVEAVGRSLADLFTNAAEAEEMRQARAATAEKTEWHGEVRLHDKQGAVIFVEMRRSLVTDSLAQGKAHLTLANDISERKSLEEQVHRAQRLENIGLLAAGIAHDLNNMLAPVLLAVPMLRASVADESGRRLLATLEYSAERGAALVRQILGFARGVGGEPQVVGLQHLLHETVKFAEGTFPPNITLQSDFGRDLWNVRANPSQINQVLINLCINARDAMPNGGTLTLRASNCRLAEAAAMIIEGGRPGAYLMIEISDTGTGIAPEVLERMWEPFVTTKAVGKGTGLGLSTVRGIIRSHHGFVELRTGKDEGTSFRIFLPAAQGTLEEPIRPNAAPLPRGQGQHILVVDDEEAIRDVIEAILGQRGYRVTTAADGAEATSAFARHAGEIELVVLDYHMPNLSGAVLAKVLRHINPDVQILMVSGLATASGSRPPVKPEQYDGEFLLKPFKPEALLRKVHALLAKGQDLPLNV